MDPQAWDQIPVYQITLRAAGGGASLCYSRIEERSFQLSRTCPAIVGLLNQPLLTKSLFEQ